MRFAVLDIDVTGTDLRRDSVTGIAALPVEAGAFRIADLVYCTLESGPHATAGASSGRRRDCAVLRDLVAGSPIVTYNPRFVRQMMSRTCRDLDLPALDVGWIDLAAAAAVMGREDNELTTMDHWLEVMEMCGRGPHDATCDVFAMAQLLLVLLAYAEETGIDTVESLARSQRARAWLRGA
jgi:hypothetical protein